ncbi:MAG TPA: hypothetical protein VJT49_28410 [Amycolatopsis sp.]|uniref:hypothetical protein n=1 Tax=Amycolatopsis sp. TaxID=37632 RepID=UPI002B47154E|nr:hypothetical protein [Amycolatopsis sp.]HKS48961.1 hypothetical protein [Amycolatopsis sp.]
MLTRLETWLREQDARIFLITGPPGSGKTSFVRQLVIRGGDHPHLAAAALALTHFCDSSNERTLDPLEFVRSLSRGLAAVIPGFADALAGAAVGASAMISIDASQTVGTVEAGASVTNVSIGLPRDVPTRQAFAQLVRRPLEAVVADGFQRRVLVVVDDLSGGYSYDSDDNIARLIGVVASNPAELPAPLRFVVTSRPDPWVLRDLPPPALDLIADPPDGNEDVRRYVDQRLSTVDNLVRRLWVDNVTAAANGNFLYARFAVDYLVAQDDRLTSAPTEHALPSGLTDLYRSWVRTVLARSRDFWWDCQLPVLSALTVARGDGLTRDQLVGITGLPVSSVRRALEQSSQFLVGSERFRLYHDSFREFLAADEVSEQEAHQAVTDFFVARHGADWLTADEYACDHLATHAAAVGDLPSLVGAPAFLVVAEPVALLHAMAQQGVHVDAYEQARWLLAGHDSGARASYLELAAQDVGDDELASALAALSLERAWRPVKAWRLRRIPNLVVGAHAGGVFDLLVLHYDDGTVVATIGGDNTLRLWDLATRTEVGSVELPARLATARLALVSRGNEHWIVVASPMTVWLVDAWREEIAGAVPTRAESIVTAVGVVQANGLDAVVLGYHDGVVEAVDPLTGESVRAPEKGHDGPVLKIAGAYADAVVSGGTDGRVIMWPVSTEAYVVAERREGRPWTAARDGRQWESPTVFPPWTTAIGCLVVEDAIALAVGFSDGVAQLTTRGGFGTGEYETPVLDGADSLATIRSVAPDGGFTEIISRESGEYTYAFAWYVNTEVRKELFADVGNPERIGAITTTYGSRHSLEFRLSTTAAERARAFEAAAADEWPAEKIAQLSGGVNSVAVTTVLGDRVLVAAGCEGGRVELFGLVDGEPAEGPVQLESEPISAVAFARIDDDEVMLAAESARAGLIRQWRLPPPPEIGDLHTTPSDFACVDENTIAILLQDGTAHLWRGPDVRELDTTGLRPLGIGTWQTGSRLWVGAHGEFYGTDADGASDGSGGSGGVRLWPADADAGSSFDVAFPDHTEVCGLTPCGDGLLAIAWSQPDVLASLWLLTPTDHGWDRTPTALEDADAFVIRPDWAIEIPGSAGRHVVYGTFVVAHSVSLDTARFTHERVFTQRVPTAARHLGEPVIVVPRGAVVQAERLGNPDILTRDNVAVEFHGVPWVEIVAVAALDDLSLVVAGTEDGRLLCWYGNNSVDLVVRLGSPVRQLALADHRTAVVRTDLGIQTIRVR